MKMITVVRDGGAYDQGFPEPCQLNWGCESHHLFHPGRAKTKFLNFFFTMATHTQAQRFLALSKGLVTLSSALTQHEVTNTKVGIAFACSATAGVLVHQYVLPWLRAENKVLRAVLDEGGANPVDAVDCVEVAHPTGREEVVCVGDVPILMTTPPDPIEEKPRKRIRKGCRGKFVREIVAAVKLRLGTPKPTMANRRAVQRVAREELLDYNLRKSVAASVMPLIVEAVFVPSKWEVKAAAVGSSALAITRKVKTNLLLELAGFNQA